MELRFEDQPYQLAAVEAVVALFDGQPPVRPFDNLLFSADGFAAVANRLDLDESQLLCNLRSVQESQDLDQDAALHLIEHAIDTAEGRVGARFANFSVEMETGTGKTYVYIRTALELARRYGFRKYVVVVPSVAIREGVMKTFAITERHFRERFPELVYRARVYRSDKLARVSGFAMSSDVEFLVLTIDSFNKESNIMRQRPDALGGIPPLHAVQATRPVLILDEPQNMQSDLAVQSLASLHPLVALRYSATHRNPYNTVHRLTPYQAYRLGLVKQIRVASAITEAHTNRPFVRVVDVSAKRHTVTARVTVHALTADGSVRESTIAVRAGDSLVSKANRPLYDGFDVVRLDAAAGAAEFANGLTVRKGETLGIDKRAIFEAQIARAIDEHVRRQITLESHGVKVLTLFFIDRVANYAEGGIIRELFDARFRAVKTRLERWKDREPHEVQAAYFAQKRRKIGAVEYVDSNEVRPKAEDEAAFSLIMRDKERLLSFEEPVSFIFSHSALREGWDNPNIFQIVTLNESVSEIRKRQEIGRGLRLAVNQAGQRITDPSLNVLTVVANESYRDYVAQLQAEVAQDEVSSADRAPAPQNADEPTPIHLRPEALASEEFRQLWARISRKTRYHVTVNTDTLVARVVQRLERAEFARARIVVTTVAVEVAAGPKGTEQFTARVQESAVTPLSGAMPVPDLFSLLAHQIEHTTPPMRLTRRTLHRVLTKLSDTTLGHALENPQEFAMQAARIIKEILADELVDGIRYIEIGDAYPPELLDPEAETYIGDFLPVERGLTDKVPVQSGVERRFVQELDRRQDVRLFTKLPRRFVVPTPVGNYNPDWAIVMTTDRPGDVAEATASRLVYMVRETKGTRDASTLRPNERRKIQCGEAHFAGALGVDYATVTPIDDARDAL